MYESIYNKIESKIKELDFERKHQILDIIVYFWGLSVVFATSIIMFFYKWLSIIILVCGTVIFSIVGFVGNFILTRETLQTYPLKDEAGSETLEKSDILKVKKQFKLQRKIKKNKPSITDIVKIIKDNGIKTNAGLAEAIEHYRFNTLQFKPSSFDFMALLGALIAIVGVANNVETKVFASFVVCFVLVLMMYIIIFIISKTMYVKLGKKAFYTRIEVVLSEILVKNLLESDECSEDSEHEPEEITTKLETEQTPAEIAEEQVTEHESVTVAEVRETESVPVENVTDKNTKKKVARKAPKKKTDKKTAGKATKGKSVKKTTAKKKSESDEKK